MKDEFNEKLEKCFDDYDCPAQDKKIGIGDYNAQIGKEEVFRPIYEEIAFKRTPTTMEKGC